VHVACTSVGIGGLQWAAILVDISKHFRNKTLDKVLDANTLCQ
jgi:hypothetical protein